MARSDQVRARDKDRVEVCALLDSALSDGQLTAAEHTTRTRSAMRAKFANDLSALIRDLQVPGELADAAILGGRPPRPWWLPVAVLVVAAVLGAVVGLAKPQDSVAAGADAVAEAPESEPAALPNLVTGSGLAFFIDSYRREFGDTVVDMVKLFPDKVLVQRVEPSGLSLYYFDAAGFRAESASLPSWSNGRPIDVGAIDLPAVAAVLAGAPASVALDGGATSHVDIGFELIAPADAGPVIEIYVEDSTAGSGMVTVSMTGQPMEINTGL